MIDESETLAFWENVAKEVGREHSAKTAVMLASSQLWADYRDRIEKKRLFDLAKIDKSMDVLDLGCGTGRWSFEFAIRCNNVLAIDFSPTFIKFDEEIARKSGFKNVVFLCKSIMDDSYLNSKYFDLIHIGGVLQYLNDDDVKSLIVNLRRHLKNDGLLISRDTISLEHRFYGKGEYPCVYRTQKELVDIFTNNGFAPTVITENMFPPIFIFLFEKFPKKIQKSVGSIIKITFPLMESTNDVLQKQKWFYRLFLNHFRKTAHTFFLFRLEKDKSPYKHKLKMM